MTTTVAVVFKVKIALCFLFFLTLTVQAQEYASPLTFDGMRFQEYQKKISRQLKTTATQSTTDTITLPFLDDFSLTTTSTADTSLWLENDGGVYINNRLPVDPPSKNVATFDGLMTDGTPYDFTDGQAIIIGLADELVSKPIDLSGIVASDSLAFSFFWQKGGRSINSFPDQDDSLVVEFLDTAGTWIYQRGIRGDTVVTEASLKDFYYEFFHITNERYLHEGFQFRFQVHCNLRGNFDIYHVDYVQLDTGRKVNEITADVAYSTPLTSYLSPYTSITRKQFFSDPAQFVADSVISYVINPEGSNFINANINQEPGYLKDTMSNTTIETMATGINALLFPGDKAMAKWTPSPANLTAAVPPLSEDDPVVLKYRFNMVTQDSLEANDSIVGYNIIDNYMAYDDGSAEGAYRYPGAGNQYALKFELLEQDTLYYIQAYFPKLINSIERKSIQWRIWGKLKGVDGTSDELYYAKTAILLYSDELNGFSIDSMTQKSDFSRSTEKGVIIPPGTFYIGFQQFSDDEIPIGFDVNTNAGAKFYSNGGTAWSNSFGTEYKVSLMLRPVFGTRKPFEIVNTERFNTTNLDFTVFPNPAAHHIKVDKKLDRLNIYDVTGTMVLELNAVDALEAIDISNLTSGVYIIEGVKKQHKAIKRFVKY